MSGVDPGVDQSATSSSSGAPKTSRDHCSCVHAVDAVRAVGEGAGQVGEPRRGMSPRALGSGRDGRDLPEAQRIRSWPPPQWPPGRAFADVSGLDRDNAGGADARRSSLLFAGGTAVSWSPQITRVDASMQPRMDAGVTLPVEDDPSTNPNTNYRRSRWPHPEGPNNSACPNEGCLSEGKGHIGPGEYGDRLSIGGRLAS